MEAKAHGVEGEKKKKNPAQNARTETHLSVLTPTSANRCDQFNEACALDLALLSGGEDLLSEKASHCTSYPLHRSMPGISLPWNWHAVLCVGTTPPRQVAPTPSARATQWASDSRSKSRSQPGSAPTRRMKGVRRGHSKIPAGLEEIKQCRNQRNLRAEKKNTHHQNSVGNDPKSRSKSPMLRELHGHLFFFFRAAWF